MQSTLSKAGCFVLFDNLAVRCLLASLSLVLNAVDRLNVYLLECC